MGRQEADERRKNGHQRLVMLPHLAVELLPCRQLWEGGLEMALGIAVKAPLTVKALPLPEQGQGDHLAPAQGRLGARGWLGWQRELAKVINHNVKSSQEGSTSTIEVLLVLGKIEQFYRLGALSVYPSVVNSHQAF
jgi:hypothetical protein